GQGTGRPVRHVPWLRLVVAGSLRAPARRRLSAGRPGLAAEKPYRGKSARGGPGPGRRSPTASASATTTATATDVAGRLRGRPAADLTETDWGPARAPARLPAGEAAALTPGRRRGVHRAARARRCRDGGAARQIPAPPREGPPPAPQRVGFCACRDFRRRQPRHYGG